MAKREPKTRHKENPYAAKALQQTVEGYRLIRGQNDNSLVLLDKTTGKTTPWTGFYQKVKVDKTNFIKLYAEGVQALLGLKPAGRKIFSVVYRRLFDDDMYGKDRVLLNYDLLTDEEKKKISESTLYRGIRDLIAAEVLAFSPIDGVYWFNPSFIYRGNRLAYVQEYVLQMEKNVTPKEGGGDDGARNAGTEESGAAD